MKNAINFFYGINVDNLTRNNDDYCFFYKNKTFIFHRVGDMTIDYNAIYKLNQLLKKQNFPIFDIILNKDNQIITNVQLDKYILMVDNNNINRKYDMVGLISNNIKIDKGNKEINSLIRTNWITMWKNKIDYLENFTNYNISKYCNFNKYINYFIGMAENGICYLNYILNIENYDMSSNLVVSHKRIAVHDVKKMYNPLNLIIDHPSRDIAEFLKSSFFDAKIDMHDLIEKINLKREDIFCLIARLIFPSYFFDLFDNLALDKITEDDILRLIDKTNEYEIFLQKTINLCNQKYNIVEIKWLKKVDYSSTLTTPITSGTSLTNMDSIPSFNVTSIMLQ